MVPSFEISGSAIYGGTFFAVMKYDGSDSTGLGTVKYGCSFVKVMKNDSADFSGSRYCKIWLFVFRSNEI